MTGRIFRSDLTGNYYYATRVKDRGNGNFVVVGKKVDVTKDVEGAIVTSALVALAAKVAASRFPSERIAPSRSDAMADFNDMLVLMTNRVNEK